MSRTIALAVDYQILKEAGLLGSALKRFTRTFGIGSMRAAKAGGKLIETPSMLGAITKQPLSGGAVIDRAAKMGIRPVTSVPEAANLVNVRNARKVVSPAAFSDTMAGSPIVKKLVQAPNRSPLAFADTKLPVSTPKPGWSPANVVHGEAVRAFPRKTPIGIQMRNIPVNPADFNAPVHVTKTPVMTHLEANPAVRHLRYLRLGSTQMMPLQDIWKEHGIQGVMDAMKTRQPFLATRAM